MDARTLSLPISTLNYNQPITVQVGSPVAEVIDVMQEGGFGCVLIVDEEQRLAGIVTERDLLVHVSGRRLAPGETPVEEVMTVKPEALRASDPIAFALNLMHLGHFRHLPLCVWDDRGNAYPVGVISTHDILQHAATFLTHQDKEA